MVVNETKLWQEIVDFVNKNGYNQNGLFSPIIVLTRKTSLENELGITGDDGIEFLEEFQNRFPFDIGDFGKLGYYFDSEGFPSFSFFFTKKKKLSLTLGMLEQAVIDGIWDSEKLEIYRQNLINNPSTGKTEVEIVDN
jgi:hypothetical protein